MNLSGNPNAVSGRILVATGKTCPYPKERTRCAGPAAS